ncbi:hypothetical protein Clacol_004035 [Clathrus columnatus]|uniref:Uncharacterized protein n=1 Tax=Clathrus columnatus TaxID=1419009 RepID=A0AAV5A593_9AGAM|nr:hypothetical protein Clacol_004035 [Clathrus columnatus]
MSNREFTPSQQQFSIRQDTQDNIRLLLVGNAGENEYSSSLTDLPNSRCYQKKKKTTLANALGKFSNFPILHLDQVQWHADGKEIIEISKEEFAGIVEKFIQENPNWIIDGDYTEAIGPSTKISATNIIYCGNPTAPDVKKGGTTSSLSGKRVYSGGVGCVMMLSER